MNTFLEKHKELITGHISVFDRLLFKGYLPYGYPEAAEKFIYSQNLLLKDFKSFVSEKSSVIAEYAPSTSLRAGSGRRRREREDDMYGRRCALTERR